MNAILIARQDFKGRDNAEKKGRVTHCEPDAEEAILEIHK